MRGDIATLAVPGNGSAEVLLSVREPGGDWQTLRMTPSEARDIARSIERTAEEAESS